MGICRVIHNVSVHDNVQQAQRLHTVLTIKYSNYEKTSWISSLPIAGNTSSAFMKKEGGGGKEMDFGVGWVPLI